MFDPSVPHLEILFFPLAIIAVLAGIATSVGRYRARQQLEARVCQDPATPPPPSGRSIEERLAELDQLNARGVISDQERADGRARIIAGS